VLTLSQESGIDRTGKSSGPRLRPRELLTHVTSLW